MIERFEHEKPATLEELTEEERRDLENLRRVKRREVLKIVCRDYVIYNGEWYRNNKWDWPNQEPLKPTIGGDADGPCGNWWYQCGKCKEAIDYHDKYCRNCGLAVKWE